MRVASSLLFESTFQAISRAQGDVLRAQSEIAANRRLLTPSDSPTDTVRVLRAKEAIAQGDQYGRSAQEARNQLELTETTLGGMTEMLARARELTVQLGNGTLNDNSRRAIATEAASLLESFMSLANRRDGDGRSMFAGFKSDVVAWTQSQQLDANGNPVLNANGDPVYQWTYNGDSNVRKLRISDVRELPVAQTGDRLFAQGGDTAFATLAAIADIGRTPSSTPVKAQVADVLNRLSTFADKLFAARAEVGARLTEVDAAEAGLADTELSYESLRSQLQDVDLVDAIGRLSRNQTVLTAAQQSFVRVQGLNLFNFL